MVVSSEPEPGEFSESGTARETAERLMIQSSSTEDASGAGARPARSGIGQAGERADSPLTTRTDFRDSHPGMRIKAEASSNSAAMAVRMAEYRGRFDLI